MTVRERAIKNGYRFSDPNQPIRVVGRRDPFDYRRSGLSPYKHPCRRRSDQVK